MKNKNLTIGSKAPLVKEILVLDGITRAGKFAVANLLNHFPRIEPMQYFGLLEHLPYLEKFGLINRQVAKEILRCEVDTHCYEMLIGRNLNMRRGDKSSVYHMADLKNYLKRLKEPDGDAALQKYYQQKLSSFFILHEVMPNIKLYFETFPNLKVISSQRNPVGLVWAWYIRGLGKRFVNDPKLFNIPLRVGKKIVPWFVHHRANEYLKAKEVDRVIIMIDSIFDLSRKGYKKLPQKYKERILPLRYDLLASNPKPGLYQIEKFLGKKAFSSIKNMYHQLGLPINYLEETKNELAEIKKIATPKYFDLLMKIEKEYHQNPI